jgi:glycosyltransferase involved in cell wall biosynthesis
MIYFIRSADTAFDSRLQRYRHALENRGFDARTIYWDRQPRSGSERSPPDELRFSRIAQHGRRYGNLVRILAWNLFILATLVRRRSQVAAVHAVDLDTALPALVFCRWFGKPLIFDIYDKYTDSRNVTGLPRRLLELLERRVLRGASAVILADPARRRQHGAIDPGKLLIVENVPERDRGAVRPTAAKPDQILKIGYLGNLEKCHRGLEHVVRLARELPFVTLEIAGTGALETFVSAEAENSGGRIRYHGARSHADGLALMAECDLILGLYYSSVPNHRFAAPNKYFEHLMLGRPLLTSQGTPPGQKVEQLRTGWAIADGEQALRDALVEIQAQPQERVARGKAARKLWDEHYASYADRVIGEAYVDRLTKLASR